MEGIAQTSNCFFFYKTGIVPCKIWTIPLSKEDNHTTTAMGKTMGYEKTGVDKTFDHLDNIVSKVLKPFISISVPYCLYCQSYSLLSIIVINYPQKSTSTIH